MPYLSFHVSKDLSRDATDKVASALTELTATLLGKKRELTAVEITCNPRWFIGAARTVQTSFYLEVKITEGTNKKNEKAAYVLAVFDAMGQILGPLAPASYIVLHEVHADAWGYEGQTQEFRYITGKAV